VAANAEPLMTLELDLHEPGIAVMRVAGECDLSEAARLADAIGDAAARAREVQLELSRLEFIDSTGLKELYRAKIELEAARGRLVLVAPTPGLRRILEIARLGNHFEIRDGAADGVGRPGAA
jgi:anti-sigma B factor antagonist